MKYCPNDDCTFLKDCGSRSTYEDHIERCLDCGTTLASGEPDVAPEGPPARLTSIGQFPADEASGILHALRADGIPVFVRGEYIAGEIDPHLPGELELQVRTTDLDEAQELLSELGADPGVEEFTELDESDDAPEPDDDSRCPNCGATELVTKEQRGWLSVLTGPRVVRHCARCGTAM